MSEYSKPKITIDLDEYNELLEQKNKIQDNPYKKMLENLINRLQEKRTQPHDPIWFDITESMKTNGLTGTFSTNGFKLT